MVKLESELTYIQFISAFLIRTRIANIREPSFHPQNYPTKKKEPLDRKLLSISGRKKKGQRRIICT